MIRALTNLYYCLSQIRLIPQTGWFKQETFISHTAGDWRPEIRVLAWAGSGESPFLFVSSHDGETELALFL